jgi:hypothetical protein
MTEKAYEDVKRISLEEEIKAKQKPKPSSKKKKQLVTMEEVESDPDVRKMISMTKMSKKLSCIIIQLNQSTLCEADTRLDKMRRLLLEVLKEMKREDILMDLLQPTKFPQTIKKKTRVKHQPSIGEALIHESTTKIFGTMLQK